MSHKSIFQERSVLPKYYTKVSPIIRPSPSGSGTTLDCSSNTTLVASTSPFNSQTALIVEKKYFSGDNSKTSSHYYAENLRNNHQKALSGSRIYNPLDKGQDVDYKQLDPLLSNEQKPDIKIAMNAENIKPPKDSQEIRMPTAEFQKEPKPSMRFATQVSF